MQSREVVGDDDGGEKGEEHGKAAAVGDRTLVQAPLVGYRHERQALGQRRNGNVSRKPPAAIPPMIA